MFQREDIDFSQIHLALKATIATIMSYRTQEMNEVDKIIQSDLQGYSIKVTDTDKIDFQNNV